MSKIIVKASVLVEVPLEDGMLGGLINKNHIMYIAAEKLTKGATCMTWDGTKGNPIFEYFIDDKPL